MISKYLPKSPFQILLLILIVLGAIIPWYFNLQYMELNSEFSVQRFLAESFANPASSSISSDLGVAAFAGVAFMIVEARRLKMKFIWIYIASACCVAFAFAFPLFLYMREVHLAHETQRSLTSSI